MNDFLIVRVQQGGLGRLRQHELSLIERVGAIQIPQPFGCPELNVQLSAVGFCRGVFPSDRPVVEPLPNTLSGRPVVLVERNIGR